MYVTTPGPDLQFPLFLCQPEQYKKKGAGSMIIIVGDVKIFKCSLWQQAKFNMLLCCCMAAKNDEVQM